MRSRAGNSAASEWRWAARLISAWRWRAISAFKLSLAIDIPQSIDNNVDCGTIKHSIRIAISLNLRLNDCMTLTDRLKAVDRHAKLSLTQQLVDVFAAAIAAGDLQPGAKLPPTR